MNFNNISNTQKGVAYMVSASLLFAITMAFAKLLSTKMGSVEVTFFRNSVGLIFIAATIFTKPLQNKGGKPYTLIFRGVVGTLALLTFFYTISATTLSSAIVYAKTEPVFTAILAFFLLKEKLTPWTFLSIFIGFVGIGLLSGMSFGYVDILGILTGFLSALAYVSVRNLKAYYDERSVVLSFMIAGSIIPIILMTLAEFYTSELFSFAFAPFVMPSGFDFIYIIFLGIAAAFGQIYMTRAYFFAKAGIVSTASYSVVLFGSFFGIMLGDVLPTPAMIAGAICVVLSGLILIRQK